MIPLKTFLSVLTRYCDEQTIRHAWARDYGGDITSEQRSDIDLLIEQRHIPSIIRFIEAWPGLHYLGRIDHVTNTQIFIQGITQGQTSFLCLDLHHHLSFKGLAYLNMASVLLRAEPATHGVGYQPHPFDLGLIYLFTRILKHGRNDAQTRSVYYTAYKNDRLEFEDILEDLFGFSGIKRIDGIFQADDTLSLRQRLKLSFVTRQIKQNGLAGLTAWLSYYIQTLFSRLRRRDIRIVVMGTDGSGKTHLIKSMLPSLTGLRSELHHAHLLPVMPWQRPPDSTLVNEKPHDKPDRNGFVSNLKLVYYACLYWLDAVSPRKGSRVIVYDRYITDLLIDPRRFRFGGSTALARFVIRHMPPIDLFVWCSTPAAVAFSRKPELPLVVMQQQYLAYEAFMAHHANGVSVDTSLPDHDAVQIITAALTSNLRRQL